MEIELYDVAFNTYPIRVWGNTYCEGDKFARFVSKEFADECIEDLMAEGIEATVTKAEGEPARYLVIAANGYWGKGKTASEAAKNAHVKGSWVSGQLFYAHPDIVMGEIDCNDGGTAYRFQNEKFTRDINGLCLKAEGRMKLVKGELITETKFK